MTGAEGRYDVVELRPMRGFGSRSPNRSREAESLGCLEKPLL